MFRQRLITAGILVLALYSAWPLRPAIAPFSVNVKASTGSANCHHRRGQGTCANSLDAFLLQLVRDSCN